MGIPTEKNFLPSKYQQGKFLDPENTAKKKSSTHEIQTRKNLGPTKCPREKKKKKSDTQRHVGTMT